MAVMSLLLEGEYQGITESKRGSAKVLSQSLFEEKANQPPVHSNQAAGV